MAYNYDVEQYKVQTPAADLDKKTLNKIAWRSMFLQASFNYERFHASGWLWGILPGLEKIHEDKDDLAASMTHNMEFVNVMPFLVTFLMGIVLKMEQKKTDIPTIRSVKVAIMGPLAGIGDSMIWLTLVPITAAICANMSLNGSYMGPILFFVILFAIQMALRFGLLYWSYNVGDKAVDLLTKHGSLITYAAAILGAIIIGALTANFGDINFGIVIANGESPIDIQAILDNIVPCLLPLLLTLFCYWLITKKKFTTIKCLFLILAIALIGAAFGIWAGSYTPLVQWF